ncbi:cysteine desulfurase [Oceanithermus profundus DSM 14977]|uniref:cysteine desulfurase n=1 Tax=Oceanithermus profundus (strain DSM 14977 / NBRC 100410 / VKM B-2274 / 506) TaxID=670487 RepID=E4U940_OCEP5|nr:cysteine desulfurase [Oceanithermus profundus]ADR36870.1 cysteine desulfurase [Oceanithermus profundus DSM 14977]
MFDPEAVKRDFPIFEHHEGLVFLDSAASSQKPRAVTEAMTRYYEHDHANVHRGAYGLSMRATEAYETARRQMARFLGAEADEVVFVRNATEALNLVAYAWGLEHLRDGDEVLVTEMEHHANLVPWQLVAARTGARIKAVPLTAEGRLDLDAFEALLSERTRVLAVTQMSNVLGTVNPVAELAAAARERGALVVVDGAQAAPHLPVRVRELNADFYALSGHKMLGPTGAGVLWGRREALADLPPFLGGGSMIEEVTIERSTYAPPPQRFEAGTPAIAEAIGLGAAADYLMRLGMENVWAHDRALLEYALERLAEVPDLHLYGPRGADRGGVIAFNLGRLHPHDLATALDERGVAVRTGHHCAQPLHRRLGVAATARASFYVYNTPTDVDRLVEALLEARKFFADWL